MCKNCIFNVFGIYYDIHRNLGSKLILINIKGSKSSVNTLYPQLIEVSPTLLAFISSHHFFANFILFLLMSTKVIQEKLIYFEYGFYKEQQTGRINFWIVSISFNPFR